MEINFFFEDVNIIDLKELIYKQWIQACINKFKKKQGNLNFIFCSDSYLLNVNKKYLNHDYYTDIITFNYCEGIIISGDIYISLDRVKENAETFDVDFYNELHRVIIHGILHLLGLDDHDTVAKAEMRRNEDMCLEQLKI